MPFSINLSALPSTYPVLTPSERDRSEDYAADDSFAGAKRGDQSDCEVHIDDTRI